MGMMAGGDLSVIIASRMGPISVVTPLSGAYPLVTLLFAWLILKEKITALQWANICLILIGMFLSPDFSSG
jgi:drug/metabolite transporter (DMT)-like permease